MNSGRFTLRPGQEASTPWPWPSSAMAPVLVACPIQGAVGLVAVSPMVQEIYQLAYEQAMAAAQPSRYGRAIQACMN